MLNTYLTDDERKCPSADECSNKDAWMWLDGCGWIRCSRYPYSKNVRNGIGIPTARWQLKLVHGEEVEFTVSRETHAQTH